MDTKRIMSAVLGIPLVGVIFIFGNKYIVDIFLSFVALIGIREYYNAISKKSKPVKWIGYLGCILIAFIHIIPNILSKQIIDSLLILGIPIIMLILFIQVAITNMKTNFKDIAYTFFGVFYVIGSIAFIALTRGMEKGKILIWYLIISSWVTDIFAYLVGKRIGKHKFSELSPKKSIEGCIAGTIGAVVVILIYTFVVNQFGFNYSYLAVTAICILLSVLSQIGDLAASSIKRYVEIKDYGNVIPGHGGVLDRIDSLMFIAPFAYVLLKIF